MYEIRYQDVLRFSSRQINEYINAVKENFEKQLNTVSTSSDLFKKGKEILNHITSAVNVVININQIDGSEINSNSIAEILTKGKALGLPVNFYVCGGCDFGGKIEDRVNLLYDNKTLEKLMQVENVLIKNGEDGLKFVEDVNYPEKSWSLDDVVEANKKIDNIVGFIEESCFSPFEAAVVIHKIAQESFSYENGSFDMLDVSCIVSILKSDKTICEGYAKFCKAVADKLNMPGLEYETFMSKIALTSEKCKIAKDIGFSSLPSGHVQNLVRIYDKKYDISGSYVSDACFDSKDEEFVEGKGFANFMFVVEDLLNYRYLTFAQPYKNVESFIYGEESEPNVVRFNKGNSKQISESKFITCLTNVYNEFYKKEGKERICIRLGDSLDSSNRVASQMFNNKSSNPFLQKEKIKQNKLQKEKE